MQVKTGIEQGSMRQFTTNLRQVIEVFRYPIHPGEEFLNSCGYNQLMIHHIQNAITIFMENTLRHPDSFNTCDSLG